jgi:hypothetical protein
MDLGGITTGARATAQCRWSGARSARLAAVRWQCRRRLSFPLLTRAAINFAELEWQSR